MEDRNYLLLHHPQLIELIETYFNPHHECIQCILQKNTSINCSQYTTDDKIRELFPFCVEHNPQEQNPSTTFILTNAHKKIYHLNIVNQKFFPPTAFCLKYLEKFYVQRSSFVVFNHQLPPAIKFLGHSLIDLEISDTKITHLSNEIGELTRLIRLKLSNTHLVSLPDEIGDLSSLKFLLLPNNKLTYLPKTINNLRLLQQLILTNNRYLHSIQPLNSLPFLRILDTRHCPIEILPRNLSKLTDLYMSNNTLTNLIDIQTLGYGTNSKKSFYFDKNYIRSISPQIRYVKNLFRLNLNDNELETLPRDIFNIPTLRELFVDNNFLNDYELKKIYVKFNVLFKSKAKKFNSKN